MPKEIKKRGRRAERKRKEEHKVADELEQNANHVPITGQTEEEVEEEAEAAYYGDGGYKPPPIIIDQWRSKQY